MSKSIKPPEGATAEQIKEDIETATRDAVKQFASEEGIDEIDIWMALMKERVKQVRGKKKS